VSPGPHGDAPTPEDLLLLDADIRTGDAASPRAAALGVRGGRVIALGAPDDVRAALARDARVVALGGRTVTPGFHDAHTHLGLCAAARSRLSLAGAASRADVRGRVAARHAGLAAGAWLRGEELAPFSSWSDAPDRTDLDAAAPGRPVVLATRDRHAALASSAALAAAGVALDARDPKDGAFGRDATGTLTGWLFETARSIVAVAAAAGDEEAPLAPVLRDLLAVGVTCVHDFGDRATWDALVERRDAGNLNVRVAFAFYRGGVGGGADGAAVAKDVRAAQAAADERLWPFALKSFADGSLGARTAHLLAPYEGGADVGLSTLTPRELDAFGAEARGLGVTHAVHAIGDAAVRTTLDAFARWDVQARQRLRPRVEHAQLVAAGDMARFAALGVIASMQPVHGVSDRALATRLWGPRDTAGGYAWNALAAAGARLAFGSDAPIESFDPRLGMHAALTGGDPAAHAAGRTPSRALLLERAMHAATGGAAWAIGREDRLGRLAPGAWADFVVWGRDPFAARAEDWPTLPIDETWVAGRRVHPSTERV
jgi:predicted amidohydrolase YtcJ